jgi:hypothetical protein
VEVQPLNNKKVEVTFDYKSNEKFLNAEEKDKDELKVYYIGNKELKKWNEITANVRQFLLEKLLSEDNDEEIVIEEIEKNEDNSKKK